MTLGHEQEVRIRRCKCYEFKNVRGYNCLLYKFFFFSSRRRHTRLQGDWSSDVCSSDLTEEELVRKIAGLPLDFQPGENWSYSNSGYLLLGVLIRDVTGEFYGDFLQQRDRKSTRLNSSHLVISYAVFCLKKKKKIKSTY